MLSLQFVRQNIDDCIPAIAVWGAMNLRQANANMALLVLLSG